MTELVRQITLAWWSWIAPASVQVAWLILLVALFDRLMPRRAWPELRAALWLLVMLKLALPPGITSPLSLTHLIPQSISLSVFSPMPVERASTAVFGAGLVVWIWTAGVLLLAVTGAIRHRRLRRSWQAGGESELPDWLSSMVADVARRVGLRRTPAVVLGRSVGTPFVVGLFRPRVHLPHDMPRRTPRQRIEHILLHELAHVRRRDAWIAAACAGLQLLYWFHPLVWLAQRRLAALREQCCDRTVARILGDRTDDYRRTLLELARQMVARPIGGQLGFVIPRAGLVDRLRLLEHAATERSWLRRSVTTATIGAMLVCGLPMAGSADRAVASVAELIERPPGCLQLRYLVLQRMAESEEERP